MRVFIDTSVFISYLLSPHQDSFIQLIFEQILEGNLTLLISEELLEEVEITVKRKKHLMSKIGEKRLARFVTALRALAEMIPPFETAVPAMTRDVNDDYLIAYSVIGEADYLVSVDKDLLILKQVGDVEIVHTGEFRERLGHNFD